MRNGIALVNVVAAVGLSTTAPALATSEPCPLLLLHAAAGSVELERVGLSPVAPARTTELRGLDGQAIAAVFQRAPSLQLGDRTFTDVIFAAAPSLPVFEVWGLGEDTGILGNDFFARFSAVEIDFGRGLLRLES